MSALSTAEAEYYALAEAIKPVLYLRNVLADIGLEQQSPTEVFIDAQAAFDALNSHGITRGMRHIATRFHRVRDEQKGGHIIVKKCATHENLSDVMTKLLIRAAIENGIGQYISIRKYNIQGGESTNGHHPDHSVNRGAIRDHLAVTNDGLYGDRHCSDC